MTSAPELPGPDRPFELPGRLGTGDTAEWGRALLGVLSTARTTGRIGWEETVHRELVVQLALASHGLGGTGIPADADEVCLGFIRTVTAEGELADRLQLELAELDRWAAALGVAS
ncbi:hypothetical protein [Kitasatospora sp. NPDC002040]|uniref:hypothetical protein n=1 Tax=Kitasatospora sp. NPDC002040 TaxID=3154661 RepID=UPI00332E10E9